MTGAEVPQFPEAPEPVIRVFETREMKAYGAGPRMKDLRVVLDALEGAGVPEDARLRVESGSQVVAVTARWDVELGDDGEVKA